MVRVGASDVFSSSGARLAVGGIAENGSAGKALGILIPSGDDDNSPRFGDARVVTWERDIVDAV